MTGDEAEIERVTSAPASATSGTPRRASTRIRRASSSLTPQGKIARYLFGIEYAAKDLRLSLVEASKGNLGTIVEQLLLLCYHYDPKSREIRRAGASARCAPAGMFTSFRSAPA